MPLSGSRSAFLIASSALLATTLTLSGCGHNGHPDERMAVYNALDQHDLRSVTVSQDRHAGTITLSGIVGSNDSKQRAEQVAQQAAPGYSIVDRIQVQNAGLQSEMKEAQKDAQLDSAIEDNFKATLASHRNLKEIHFSAYNQTLTLERLRKDLQGATGSRRASQKNSPRSSTSSTKSRSTKASPQPTPDASDPEARVAHADSYQPSTISCQRSALTTVLFTVQCSLLPAPTP